MVEIDADTINRARRISGIEDAAELTRVCITQWIQHEAARHDSPAPPVLKPGAHHRGRPQNQSPSRP